MFNKIKEDLDLYVMATITVIILVIDLFDSQLVSIDLILKIILVVLAILSFSLIKNRENDKKLKEELSVFTIQPSIAKYGINSVIPKMNYELFDSKIKNAKKEIVIMQTWLNAMEPISEDLKDAINRGVKVKILLLKENSELAKNRNQTLGYGYNSQRSKALYSGVLSSLLKTKSPNLELRVHEFIPPFSMYCVDNWMLIGYYWYSRGSLSNPMIEVVGTEKKKIGWNFKNTFDEMWNNSSCIIVGES